MNWGEMPGEPVYPGNDSQGSWNASDAVVLPPNYLESLDFVPLASYVHDGWIWVSGKNGVVKRAKLTPLEEPEPIYVPAKPYPTPSSDIYPAVAIFPGMLGIPTEMWEEHTERYFMHGIDRGVLYIEGKDPVPWNGLTNVEESSNGESAVHYRDGRIYLAEVIPGDYTGQATAWFFPDEFSECLGIPEVAHGMYVDNQRPKPFSFAYRSLIGSGTTGDMFGYQIHLVYNAVATLGTRKHKTLTGDVDMAEFTFDLVATPIQLPGYRPSAHYIIDTRNLDPGLVLDLELMIYGSNESSGKLPTPSELLALLDPIEVA